MRVIFCGNNQRGMSCLEYLYFAQAVEISLVVGHHSKDNTSSYYCDLAPVAKRYSLKYISPPNINSSEVRDIFRHLEADLIVLCGYSQNILRRETFELAKYGGINVHASLLPNYRGASPLNWALINGESVTGYSIIQIDEGIDTGPILFQEKVTIASNENIASLTSKINEKIGPALLKCISNIENMLSKKVQQSPLEGSFYSKRFPKDGKLKFRSMSSIQVINMVRGLCYPYPGAYFLLNGIKHIVDNAKNPFGDYRGVPGRVVKIEKPNKLIVICSDRGVLLELRAELTVQTLGSLNKGIDIDD